MDTNIFTHEAYAQVMKQTFAKCVELGTLKGGEYSGDTDRLANFRRNGEDQELPKETIWRVYAAKHWDAIGQYIKDIRQGKNRKRLETIDGRIDDLIVYLILLKCMVVEAQGAPEVKHAIAIAASDRVQVSG